MAMYCRKCGKSIPDDSVFCPYCGSPTDPEAQKTKAGVRGFGFKILLSLLLVAAVLVCVCIGFLLSAPGRNVVTEEAAPPQSTVSTLPPETTSAETESHLEETAFSEASEEILVDADPWRHVDTMEEAEEILGFGLEAPEIVKDFEAPWINVATDSSNLWVAYHKYTQGHDPMYYNKIITVRRSISITKYPCPDGTFFVSPDAQQKLVKVDGSDVVLVMDGNEVISAEWAADGYAYDLSFENMGLTAYTVVPLISQTH